MRDSVMWFLVSAVVISSLLVVFIRHQHRIAYTLLHAEQSRRDALNDEWGQLLTEANLYSFPHRIESFATQQLSMRPPSVGEVVFVKPDQQAVAQLPKTKPTETKRTKAKLNTAGVATQQTSGEMADKASTEINAGGTHASR